VGHIEKSMGIKVYMEASAALAISGNWPITNRGCRIRAGAAQLHRLDPGQEPAQELTLIPMAISIRRRSATPKNARKLDFPENNV